MTSQILSRIDSPADLRLLDPKQLVNLAEEIRETIIDTVSVTGGHLAPCLGVVELTLALHYIFDTPTDKLVWDVGHQVYTHKLITGRRDKFHTLRQYKGISGFPKREESEYDAFDTGHSSTSISAALGISLAKFLKGDTARTLAVIGDGSMTGGMAFEALNQAGHLDKNLIVILNDNEMSISPNVGALSSFLSRKLSGKTIVHIKREMESFLKGFHGVGENILQVLKKSEESFKGFFTPGMLFEALKFEYIGPIDGHDLPTLLETLENVKNHHDGPVLIHVLTTKGKGYEPAEKNPGAFHGVGPFNKTTGEPIKPKIKPPPSYTKVFGDTMLDLAAKDPRVVTISAAMPAGTGLSDFSQKFPDRFFDVGIAEQHAVTFAAGMATEGFKPFVAIYSTFLQRAYDQVVHDVAVQNLPVRFAIDRAGLVGADGPTHAGSLDVTYLASLPNFVVRAAADELELVNMVATSVSLDHCPSAVRYPRGEGIGIDLPETGKVLKIGKGRILQKGSHIAILSLGTRLQEALQAAETLRTHGLSTTVADARFAKPLDLEMIRDLALNHEVLVTIEEGAIGGFGSHVLDYLSNEGLLENGLKVRTLKLPDIFQDQNSPEVMYVEAGLCAADITEVTLKALRRNDTSSSSSSLA
ncbi:MAG: 1-deoxy-D-xylulose-5-phosphate synthase [Emcibacter sp.]|nr:1-deoxy-D-xylulose-5-phosphate synthase [Emcibacter sp.]